MKSITSLLLLCSLLAGSPTAQTPAPRADLLDRVVVMGASVSAGFGLCKDLEVATPLRIFGTPPWSMSHVPPWTWARTCSS
ncbi:MAG: hypothetical protein R3E96_09030 [Planctomycetota bacterium]